MSELPRLLVVDDEEAILETMTFTFEDDYEVLTSASAEKALGLLDDHGPVAVVLSDQRMPEMTGVEFLSEVFNRHPETVRIILTGFADMDAIIHAINDGHVYAYITKPWEPDQLKQVVRRAVEHYELARENERLLTDLRDSNQFLEAVMDHLDTGAIAVDAEGVVRALNEPARKYLGLTGKAHGLPLGEVIPEVVLRKVAGAAVETGEHGDHSYEEVDLPVGGGVKLRIAMHPLMREGGAALGQVILAREISHEPLRRRFEEIVEEVADVSGDGLREKFGEAKDRIESLQDEVGKAGVVSPGMGQLSDRASRTLTAFEYWQAVDDALASEEFPDAQLLVERIRLAGERWPLGDRLPERVRELGRRVETYYQTGENPKQRVL
jgi:FixJ family two-component response regulator